MSETTTWPPPTGLSTPHVPRESANLTIHASAPVSAPASLVWQTLNDIPSWPNWNTWIPHCDITSQPPSLPPTQTQTFHPQTEFTFHVRMNPSKPSSYTPTTLRVSSITTPDDDEKSDYVPQQIFDQDPSYDANAAYRISWRDSGSSLLNRGLSAERFHEIIPTGERSCEVRTWECQGGPLAYVVKWMYGKFLTERLGMWCEDLKREAERRFTLPAVEGEGGGNE